MYFYWQFDFSIDTSSTRCGFLFLFYFLIAKNETHIIQFSVYLSVYYGWNLDYNEHRKQKIVKIEKRQNTFNSDEIISSQNIFQDKYIQLSDPIENLIGNFTTKKRKSGYLQKMWLLFDDIKCCYLSLSLHLSIWAITYDRVNNLRHYTIVWI